MLQLLSKVVEKSSIKIVISFPFGSEDLNVAMDACIATKEEPMNRHISLRGLATIILLFAGCVAAEETPNRVTILYDAFGKSPSLTKDFGFAALVEYGGKRILFDTGNNAKIFEHNVRALGVDLRNIDFVVISHRHADHTSGITYLLTVNPKVQNLCS